MKKKILFFIFDLRGGGAEKVLINALKFLNPHKYDITLLSIFNIGPYKNDIPPHIKYKYIFNFNFKGFNTLMKFLSPKLLHKLFVRDKYDIEVSFLETSPSRIISGCNRVNTKTITWVHIEIDYIKQFIVAYRNRKEAVKSYSKFNKIIFVADSAKKSFDRYFPEIQTDKDVIYNINDFTDIEIKSKENIDIVLDKNKINICSVGRICGQKGYDRLLEIIKMLKADCIIDNVHFYLIGEGAELLSLKQYATNNNLHEYITFLGFKHNPYKYTAKMDLFISSSIKEGYSTAVTEAIALNIPVITTLTSGMNEILENGKYGIITKNDTMELYNELKKVILNPKIIEHYKSNLINRKRFSTSNYIAKYEELFDNI